MNEFNTAKKTEITLFKTPSIDVCGIAFLMLMFAKLFGYANISWWIVTAPLWGPIAICFGVFMLYYVAMLLFASIAAFVVCSFMAIEFVWFGLKKIYTLILDKVNSSNKDDVDKNTDIKLKF